ncbi:bifunctional 4-hydroxy-2-oxoglutarate aldolase/2-dehydro-3-deoxy-phosphogluconate aldolase [Paenibacillus doosanensis]|uniref:bifunctional 4-hydroxy-2-oxoglutarate aldolase/2-dehydro-3-deoxy-phosphogluconate aldolase n=1 Tax=Paenibacillus doosanensis TaxID=1229154 RepID=UPI00217F8CB6|nr:bifunctional 4-hydroxy-2-oxoglutarate aldolase/2-dehydro-3-deoxy-phosphogluconate aldolase [Paenibacillus doosanensis]MCS7462221.1 bifunctional 4-hydroxy-2-oxoglutarate aldolase/2-dehydro-3-deoxy-phosphogluconate aldolase [Paenibacillus doosanensis]
MKREQGLQLIEETKIIAIVRGVEKQHVIGLAQALLDGGVKVMEITLNTPGAADMIELLQRQFGEQMYIGAGTVLDMDDARAALAAGASYLVTPNTDEEVIRYAAEQGAPIYPGAMTPSEIVRAWKTGASAVKIFPGASLGIGYLKELQGPLSHIPMVAVGGVNEENIGEFLRIGCHAVGIGGSLVNLKEIAAGNYSWVRDKAARLAAGARSSRN